jgi:methylenetetrahydrofolate dehydrogenase (NADP+)/methenyltetrahydrofolate cyclohydrolase
LVGALGRPLFLTKEHVQTGATVIDVGVNRVPDPASPRGYRLVGDVDFSSVQPVAGAITPNPGGVGPMTIALLLSNTVRAAEDASS